MAPADCWEGVPRPRRGEGAWTELGAPRVEGTGLGVWRGALRQLGSTGRAEVERDAQSRRAFGGVRGAPWSAGAGRTSTCVRMRRPTGEEPPERAGGHSPCARTGWERGRAPTPDGGARAESSEGYWGRSGGHLAPDYVCTMLWPRLPEPETESHRDQRVSKERCPRTKLHRAGTEARPAPDEGRCSLSRAR